MLARAHLPTVDHLADVEAVAQQISEGTTRKGNAPDGPPVRKAPHLGSAVSVPDVPAETLMVAMRRFGASQCPGFRPCSLRWLFDGLTRSHRF